MAGLLFHSLATAEDYGPYAATLVRVIDGDTVLIDARIWPGQTVRSAVRLRGIDTPEKGGRAHCLSEREAGQRSTSFTRRWLAAHPVFQITDVRSGKFSGRVLGRIVADDADLAEDLLAAGMARPYDGGKRASWCDTD